MKQYQYKDTKYIRRQSRSLSEERLCFRNGERMGDILIGIENGKSSARFVASSRSACVRTTGTMGSPVGLFEDEIAVSMLFKFANAMGATLELVPEVKG